MPWIQRAGHAHAQTREIVSIDGTNRRMGVGLRRVAEKYVSASLALPTGTNHSHTRCFLLPPTDRMRQATGIGERNFQRTSNQRNETMMKEASDFASHLRKCDRAIAEMKSACETVLSTTKIAMNAPLPRAFCCPLLPPRARRLSRCPPSPRHQQVITTPSHTPR